jgi:hypothetical protein
MRIVFPAPRLLGEAADVRPCLDHEVRRKRRTSQAAPDSFSAIVASDAVVRRWMGSASK